MIGVYLFLKENSYYKIKSNLVFNWIQQDYLFINFFGEDAKLLRHDHNAISDNLKDGEEIYNFFLK